MKTARFFSSIRQVHLSVLLALVALPMADAAVTAAKTTRPYNVLFLVADDLRADIEAYGHSEVKTPHLRDLARSGLLFERAYCQQAVCGPSRASVLSGARPDKTGIYENAQTVRMSRLPDLITLPQLFRQNGYRSLSVGKVFHHEEVETGGAVSKRPGDDALSWSETPWYHGDPYQQWFNEESFALLERLRSLPPEERPRRGPPYEASNQPDEVYPDGQIASKAIQTLRELKNERFFLAVGFRRPHLPFNCPQKYWDLYPADSIRIPDNYYPPTDVPEYALHNGYELRSYAGMPKTGPIPEGHARNLIRGYRATVSYMDAQLGKVLAELDRLGLRENTIVVFWSDHGFHLGENSLWSKMTNFEISARTPLILRVPGVGEADRRTQALVELVDIYPTLAELCGLPLPPHLDGRSCVPLLDNPNQAWKQAVYTQFPRRGRAQFNLVTDPMGRSMRTERYRYTEWTNRRDGLLATELYDLVNDPANNVNLANRPEHRVLVAQLASELSANWR